MWDRLERREISRRAPRTWVPGAARPRPDLPAGTDLLPQIKHIVVVMMENHSYDNYLGMLAGRGEGLPLGDGGVPATVNSGPDGFRVPAVVVSPYARPGYLCRGTYDHTSVLKLIEEKWNLPPLTRRDAAAESPLEALDLDAPPAFAAPPRLPEPRRPGAWTRS